ncbi:MAG: penicillin-binding transpeptidase domain-containing protein [Eubacteriales bacterium]
MTQKKLSRRNFLFVALTLTLFLFMLGTLYSAQIIYGQEYTVQAQRKIVESETVDVARGAILDRYGRVLVSNEVIYQLELSWDKMGSDQNEAIAWLLTTVEEEGVAWNSSLTISDTAPYVFTGENIFYGTYQDENGEDYRVLTRLGNFCLAQEWIQDPREGHNPQMSAKAVLEKLIDFYDLGGYPEEMQRDMVAVSYDLSLRELEIRYDAYYFAENIDITLTTKVMERDYSGMTVTPTTQRVFGTDYAAHLLGRVSSMNTTEWEYYKTLGYPMDAVVGKEGVEQAFESYLRGESGLRIQETNTQGDIMSAYWEEEPEAGGNVVLTLDIELQKKVEDVLATEIPLMNNDSIQGGACVIMEVNTGAVLVAASYPTFDLGLYGEQLQANLENELNPLFNRALQGTYAPGSTFKMVTGLAALEEEIVTPTTTIRDSGPFDYYQDYSPACWIYNLYGGTHGWQNISDAIKNSCNYYFYQVGLDLGIDRIGEYAAKFGLGEPSGIELQEKQGVMASPEYTNSIGQTWYDGATLSVAIGQENSAFTPLQMTNYICTLVNGGTHYDAHLLQEVKSGDFSQIVYTYDPEEHGEYLGFDQTNLDAVLKGMENLITSGSVSGDFQNLARLGISVGGKTGTAQLTGTATASANAVFVCYAPVENPEIALTLVVEKGGSGGKVASMAAEILEYYFTNQENREDMTKENVLMP